MCVTSMAMGNSFHVKGDDLLKKCQRLEAPRSKEQKEMSESRKAPQKKRASIDIKYTC